MARLSGLASEHHPIGPGDVPRRKRGRKSKQGSVDTTTSTGSKRAASPNVEVHTKRPKRVQVDDHEQLSREADASLSRSQEASSAIDDDDVRPTSSRSGPSSRRRHSEPFAAIEEEAQPNSDDDLPTTTPRPATQPPPSGLTPHLARLGTNSTTLFKAKARARMSLPAQLHITDVDSTDGSQEVQFAPLSAVLDDRIRRRLRRNHLGEEMNEIEGHKREDAKLRKAYAELQQKLRDKEGLIEDLEYQLEASRLGNIELGEDRTAELVQQLGDARRQIEELKASSVFEGEDEEEGHERDGFALGGFDDDGDVELGDVPASRDDLGGGSLGLVRDEAQDLSSSHGFYAVRALADSQITMESLATLSQTTKDILAETPQPASSASSDKISDQAVSRYEAEIKAFARRVGELEGAIRVVTLELQNMHLLPSGTDMSHILTQLRHVLEESREKYTLLFPHSSIAPTNIEFLQQIMHELEGMNAELLDQTVQFEQKVQRVQVLQTQYENAMDVLSSAETSNQQLSAEKANLQTQVQELEQERDNTMLEIGELQTSDAAKADELVDKEARINGLLDELEDKSTDHERVRKACDSYRAEVENLTSTITKLELEFAERIKSLEDAHAEEVTALTNQLAEETSGRLAAEEEAQQARDFNDELSNKFEDINAQFDECVHDITRLRQRLAEEEESRKTTEAEREDLAAQLYGKTNEVEDLSETIQDLESQLGGVKTELEDEKTLREDGEQQVKDRDDTIAALEDQIHNAGIQANELRSKLFQSQMQREEEIAALEADAQARIDELGEELERQRRRADEGERDLETEGTRVAELEREIRDKKGEIERLVKERDELAEDLEGKIRTLSTSLDELSQKYTALEDSSKSTIDSLNATISSLNTDIADLEAATSDLHNTALETAQTHDAELADRDAAIANLESALQDSRTENEQFRKENGSLAKRLEDGAVELLNIMGAHDEEVAALRVTISTQAAHISTLQTEAETARLEHGNEISDLRNQVDELVVLGEDKASLISELEAQIAALQEKFEETVSENQDTVEKLMAMNRRNLAEQEDIAKGVRERGGEILEGVRKMGGVRVRGVGEKVKVVDLKKVVAGKVVKSRKGGSKRKVKGREVRDSGIGMDDGETEAEAEGEDVEGEGVEV